MSIGDTVNLQCLIDPDSGGDVVDWLFEESSIKDRAGSLGDNYEFEDDNGILTIKSFEPSNAGLYRCVIESKEGRCISKTAKLSYFNSKLAYCIVAAAQRTSNDDLQLSFIL